MPFTAVQAPSCSPVVSLNRRCDKVHRRNVAVTVCSKQVKSHKVQDQQIVKTALQQVATALAVAQVLSSSVTGVAGAVLNTRTEPAPPEGAGALIEYSDITDETSKGVVEKLKKYLPQVQAVLAEAYKDEGSKYPSSIIKELETVADEINQLERQVADGSNASNVKSFASGIEQQISALKAIVGFD